MNRNRSGDAAGPARREPRRGYTTGACVQAATRAAALTVATGYIPCENAGEDGPHGDRETTGTVEVTLPNGEVSLFLVTIHAEGVCSIIKDAGDDPDITDGLQIFVCVAARLDGRFSVDGAEGVGRVTLEGLQVKPGRAAINPVPLKFIRAEARRVLPRGADVTISLPAGEELAARTFNPKLGIAGGLSILGTTGRVEPWSSAAYRESLLPQLDVARAAGVKRPVLVPGAKGERAAKAAGFEDKAIIQTGNYTGMMLAAAKERGMRRVTLLGHVSKLAKVARGDFNTHSRHSPMPLDVLAEAAGDAGWSRQRARALLLMPTTEAAVEKLGSDAAGGAILDGTASRVAERVRRDFGITAQVMLTDGHGAIIGKA